VRREASDPPWEMPESALVPQSHTLSFLQAPKRAGSIPTFAFRHSLWRVHEFLTTALQRKVYQRSLVLMHRATKATPTWIHISSEMKITAPQCTGRIQYQRMASR